MNKLFIILLGEDEIAEYIDLVPNIYNPVYISIIIFFIILLLVYISFRHIYLPILKKHEREQAEYETNTARLLELFSDLDPNPIIRIDDTGLILNINQAAKTLFKKIKLNKSRIDSFIDPLNQNIADAINSDKLIILSQQIGEKFYEINFQGISFLKMAQLYFRDITLKKKYDEQIEKYHELQKNTASSIQKVQDNERIRISRELHDSVGQNLLLIKLNISRYKKFLPLGMDENEYKRTLDILDSTINKVRDVARNLKPVNLDELDLFTLLKTMCLNVVRETGLKYHLQLSNELDTLTKELQLAIYSIIQESLNNIIRYAIAREFILSIVIEQDIVTLSISDDGIGFIPDKLLNDKYVSKGFGIMNMQEITDRLNGKFQIDSSVTQGTNIIAVFPAEYKHEAEKRYKTVSR